MEKKVFSGKEERFYKVAFSQILYVREKFSGSVRVIKDISERKQTERELADSQRNEQLQRANTALNERTCEHGP